MRKAALFSALVVAVAIAASLAAIGCGGKGATQEGAGAPEIAAPPTGEGHAGAGVVPGSHEDWCVEHEVAETQCTRCDASLIPAFQASGDWDAEHGLPKSQCRTCDPNLEIVRPPKQEG